MEQRNYKGQKILAVDDMKEYLEVLAKLLEKLFPGISVFTALSGKEGLELARKEKPDVILLDIVMPEMDGLE
ncbi:MAG: response regulator, partial [bacterium]|nr:response regulator [bacterium]